MSYQLYEGDCLEILPTIKDLSCHAFITDPPYGCGKAEWDNEFPTKWYAEAKRIADMTVIITGSSGLKDSIALVGDDFVDVIAAWNRNGMTRGPIGYGNWLAAVVACSKPSMGPNFLSFTIAGDMPDHPSPKPISYMKKLIERVTKPGDLIIDCFMGSGRTGVAALQTGRRFIGIELNAEYFQLAKRDIEDAARAAAGQPKILTGNQNDMAGLPMFAEIA